MEKWVDIGSFFYEHKRKPKIFEFGADAKQTELASFISQNKLTNDYGDINSIKYTILNRLEFQRSLATKYVQGGVYGKPASDDREALTLANDIVDEIFPLYKGPVDPADYDFSIAYKIHDDSWCDLLNGMLNWSYIVYDPINNRWRFLYYNSSS